MWFSLVSVWGRKVFDQILLFGEWLTVQKQPYEQPRKEIATGIKFMTQPSIISIDL